MKTTYTLIVGDADTYTYSMEFHRIDSIRTYADLDAAVAAGEAAIEAGASSWCIPELYTWTLTYTREAENASAK